MISIDLWLCLPQLQAYSRSEEEDGSHNCHHSSPYLGWQDEGEWLSVFTIYAWKPGSALYWTVIHHMATLALVKGSLRKYSFSSSSLCNQPISNVCHRSEQE
jgi:hypothetical protein